MVRLMHKINKIKSNFINKNINFIIYIWLFKIKKLIIYTEIETGLDFSLNNSLML
jgi:hypothetical protein